MNSKLWIQISISLVGFSLLFGQNFKTRQLKNFRVSQAYQQVGDSLKKIFENSGVSYPPEVIYIRILKKADTLQLWARDTGKVEFEWIKGYSICDWSGSLGPKKKQGDLQVPEGFYYVEKLNPVSDYHLSLLINYPNKADSLSSVLSDLDNLGSAICIHGACASIGCIAIKDKNVKEVYIAAVEAKNAGQEKIPVHIFPAKMDSTGWSRLKNEYEENKALLRYWENLKEGYDYFEEHRTLPEIRVNQKGKYRFSN